MQLLLKRMATAIPALLLLSFTVFLLIEIAPGDIADTLTASLATQGASGDIEAASAAIREEIGADRPFIERYVMYTSQLLQGNMGWSVRTQLPVHEEIGDRLPNTLFLMAGSLLVALTISIALGASAALQHNRWWDQLVTVFVSINQALPSFWVALVLVWIFSVQFGLLPVYGYSTWQHWVLPIATLALSLSSGLIRIVRVSILEGYNAPHINVARAKGLGERTIFGRHLLRVVAIPIVAYTSLQATFLVGGIIIIEVVFGISGLGELVVRSVNDQDPMLLQGVTLVIATLTFLVLALFDLLVAFLDPRIRY